MKKIILYTALIQAPLFSGSASFSAAGGGDWGVAGNWTAGGPPNGIDEVATFPDLGGSARVVTLTTLAPTVGTLTYSSGDNYTISTPGTNVLTFQVSAGTAAIGASAGGVNGISCPITLTSSVSHTKGVVGGSFTISGAMSGGGGYTKLGIGAVILSGANTYSGGTTVSAGTLIFVGAGSLLSTGAVTLAGGTLSISSVSGGGITIGSLVFNSGALSQGTKSLTLSGTGTSLTMGNSTTIPGPLIFSAAGDVLYNGTTTAATISGTVGLGSSLAHTFNIGGGSAGTDMLISGLISGTGTSSITKTGAGTLTLTNGSNSYTGGTTITDGILSIGADGNLGASATGLTFNGAGAILEVTNTFSSSSRTTTLTGPGTFQIDPTFIATWNGQITGSGGTLTKTGTGILTLMNASNNYSTDTNIFAGTLALSGFGAIATSSAVNVNGGTFDISATSGTTIKDLSGVGGGFVTLGSNQLIFGTGNSLSFDGVISGSGGSIIKSGGGIETFTGANTYTGGTTINDGTLALSGLGSLASTGTVTINSTGTFDISALSGGGTPIGSLVFNSGTLTQGGKSLTLSGAGTSLTMGDSTTISGPLVFSAAGNVLYNGSTTVATISGTVNLGSSLAHTFNIGNGLAGTDMLVSGGMSGTGASITKTGPGTLTLSAANTFTGGITISSGTLALSGTGSVAPSNFVDIASGAFFDLSALTLLPPMPTLTTVTIGNITGAGTLALGANNLTTTTTSDSTFSGTITGTGDLEKAGAAKWILPSNNSAYLETTTVSAGNLNLNGSLGGPVIVNAGATISGNGSMGGLTISGIINTGNSIGIMTVLGNLTILPGSQTIFEIDPVGNSDLILVTGTASVAGEIFIDFTPGVYIEGTTYTAVNATGGVSGTFFPIVDNNADFDVQLFYFPNLVQLFLRHTQLFFGITFTDPNAQAVANALALINSSGGLDTDPDLNSVVNSFVGQPTSVIQNALIQMQPSQLSAFSELSAEHGLNLITLLQDRYEMCCKTGCLNCDQNYNVWVTPYGESFNQKPLNHQLGFDTNTYGVAVGGQGSIHHTTLGVALAYDHSNVEWNRGRGHGDVNNVYAGGYVYQKEKYFYAGLAALYGHNNFEATRHLKFTTINRHAKSNFGGNEAIAQATFGLCFKSFIDFSPYADVTYVGSLRNKFKEHGAQSLNLRVDSNWSETMFYDAGIDFKKTYVFGTVCLTPDVKIGWLREDPISREKYKSRFINHPQSFKTTGYNKTQNFFTPGFRLSLDVKEMWSVSGDYNLQIGPHFFGQNGSLDVKYAF